MTLFPRMPPIALGAAIVIGQIAPSLAAAADDSSPASQRNSDTLPVAKSGECYAKVSVPAIYKIEEFEVVTKEGSENIEVTPAAFKTMDASIMVKEASTNLVPVDAELATITEQVLISEAEHVWMRVNAVSELPASKGLLSDLVDSGVDIENVAVGSCFHEHMFDAVYEEKPKRVKIADATELPVVVPAVYNTVQKQVLLKPASLKLEATEAEYETVLEDVVVEAAHSAWKKGRGLIERIDNTTGEIMCRVDVPAVYESVEKKIIKKRAGVVATRVPAEFITIPIETLQTDATEKLVPVEAKYTTVMVREKVANVRFQWLPEKTEDSAKNGTMTGNMVCLNEVPAEYENIERQVVRTPAGFQKEEGTAVFEDFSVEKLISEASEQRTPIPPQVKTMIRRVKVSDSRLEWRPVLCETNMSKEIVRELQRALNDKGYSAGAVDGLLGKGTMRAIEKYQEDQNLAQGGLTFSTIESLGVELLVQ